VAAPLLLGLFPAIRVPAVVLEIVAGIVVGPAGLKWVKVDLPIQILSLMGLAFLLFLAGLEIDIDRLRGRLLGLAGLGYVATLVVGFAVGIELHAALLLQDSREAFERIEAIAREIAFHPDTLLVCADYAYHY